VAYSLGVKRLGRVADYSPPSSAEVKTASKYKLHSSIRLHVVKVKVKGKVVLVLNYILRHEDVFCLINHTMKTYRGSGGTAPRILSLAIQGGE
jgi:hypothetical protein